jgi:hypothetical protein
MLYRRIHLIARRSARYAVVVGLMLMATGARGATFTFQTLNNNADPTFNQLLSINNTGTIAGYFGSGMTPATHPNKGYTLAPPYGQANYTNENFPASVQTQVTGINSTGVTVGFWANANNDNLGFVKVGSTFTSVVDPNTPISAPGVPVTNQLLGLNDMNQAVGFYNDAAGNSHGYVYNITSQLFTAVPLPAVGATSETATGINNSGLISGFYTAADGSVHGFVENLNGSALQTFEAPGSTNTMFLGLNNNNFAVGVYTDAAGVLHGLEWGINPHSFQSIDDPNALQTSMNGTTINGINDLNQLVGFYTDINGNTNGLLATAVPEPSALGMGIIASLTIGLCRFVMSRRRPPDA